MSYERFEDFSTSLLCHNVSVPSYVNRMLLVTIMVDKAITNTFVIHSLNLPIKIARNHDDEEVRISDISYYPNLNIRKTHDLFVRAGSFDQAIKAQQRWR